MTVVARDGEKVGRSTAFAEIAQHYVGMHPSEGERARGLTLGKLQRLRIRRVLAVVGRALCEFTFEELASVLGLKRKGTAERLVRTGVAGLHAAALDMGIEPSLLFEPRRQGEARYPEPAAAERKRPSGGRRSDRMRSLQRSGDARG